MVFLSLLILLFALNCLCCMHKLLLQSVLILDKYFTCITYMCMLFLSLNKLLNNSCCTSANPLHILLQTMHSNTHYCRCEDFCTQFTQHTQNIIYTIHKCVRYSVLYNDVLKFSFQKDNHIQGYVLINFILVGPCWSRVYVDLTCCSSLARPQAKPHVFPMCVFVSLPLCECTQTSRSAQVQLVMALLCLVGTAATVTFPNAMNQRQGGQAGRPKNNQLYSSKIDIGRTGQRERERWRHTEHTPRTNKQQRMRAQTDRGPSGLQHQYGGSEGPILIHH